MSTRGGVKGLSFEEAIMMGLAEDGGLLIPERMPELYGRDLKSLSSLSYSKLAFEIMSKFIGNEMPKADLQQIIAKSYDREGEELEIPIVDVKGVKIAELFHGPTYAFKDVALQFLGNLFEYYLVKNNQTMNIVGATSGDTGSAAIYGMRGKKNMNVFILYPEGRVSNVQELQMTTVPDENIHCISLSGNFDNCQEIVKTLFSDLEFKKEYKLGAVNSINWARILAQVVYYFYIYFRTTRVVGEKVNFAVPTGNFGNIFAGYIAKMIGLPIGKLVLSTNKNNILARSIKTGDFSTERVQPSISPAMDIQVPSNFERYLYFLYDKDSARVIDAMKTLSAEHEINFRGPLLARLQRDFLAADTNDDKIRQVIQDVYRETDYILDPHTACGYNALSQFTFDDEVTVCLSTAHPAKFQEVIHRTLGFEPPAPKALAKLIDLPRRTEFLPNDVDKVRSYIISKLDG